LGLLGSDEAVAALRVGERGAQFVALSLALVNMVIAPHIVITYRQGNIPRLQQISRQSSRGAFLLALPVALTLIFFGKPLISLVFGPHYAETAYMPMVVLVLGQLFNVAMGSVGILLSMSGHEKSSLLCQAVGLGTTLILGVVLIPPFHELGAAVAVAVGLVVWNLGIDSDQ
jgi:O-antigen/teichoic acid export membrane protein